MKSGIYAAPAVKGLKIGLVLYHSRDIGCSFVWLYELLSCPWIILLIREDRVGKYLHTRHKKKCYCSSDHGHVLDVLQVSPGQAHNCYLFTNIYIYISSQCDDVDFFYRLLTGSLIDFFCFVVRNVIYRVA